MCGIVSCFFGYRLFRTVLAVFGFILGALAASSVWGVSDTWPMLAAAAVGGLIGAGVMFAAYFVGVALVGAALGRGGGQPGVPDDRPRAARAGRGVLLDPRRGGLHLSPALLPDRRHRLRRGVDAHRRRDGRGGEPGRAGRGRAPPAACGCRIRWIRRRASRGCRLRGACWGLLGTTVQLGWTGGEKGRVVRRPKKA